MAKNYSDLKPTRDELARSLAGKPGFDSVGITNHAGELALSVFLEEPAYSSTSLPVSYNGYAVVRKKASDFVPHQWSAI
jgi:hypothetical protein